GSVYFGIISRRRRPNKSKTPLKVAAFDRNHWQHIIGIGGRVCAGLSTFFVHPFKYESERF
ncbi:hypothetical protein, partial [Draconibacterium sp.]|uniref:hypothetical protein n=1 Tax=Draconibacterium sp. TaxID=1965318 RepID=UPI00356924E0